jgi:diacylglycerol kinase (ATP)
MIAERLVVVNPASSGGRTYRRWPATAALLLGAGIDFETRLTRAPGEATEMVRGALRDGCSHVIAVGGDGTLNEVVHGFFDDRGTPINAEATLGLIPSGTGGDFRKAAGIPAATERAVDVLAAGHSRRVDAGRIDFSDGSSRHFINIADCGLGGDVVARVNRNPHKTGGLRGTAVFLGASLAALWSFRAQPVRMEIDGRRLEATVESVVVANGRYFGAGMHIAPGAALDDGLFDVVVVEERGHLRSLRGLPGLYRGTHLRQRGVSMHPARVVRIESLGEPLLFDVEGEQIGRTPATLTCLEGAIRLCVPAHTAAA